MKGVVFHFGKKSKVIPLPGCKGGSLSIRSLFSRYGVSAFLVTLFMMGLIVGSACSKGIGDDLTDRLDFLFITNIAARSDMSGFGIFLSCFVPYFLFIFAAFLFAFSAWGFLTIPLLSAFKGFSVGLSSALIFAMYKASGIGFYILIVLPGTVLFLFTFIRYSRDSFRLSAEYARLTVFGSSKTSSLGGDIRSFLKKSLFAFLFCGACSVVDMLLWVLFADKFHFY